MSFVNFTIKRHLIIKSELIKSFGFNNDYNLFGLNTKSCIKISRVVFNFYGHDLWA